MRTTAVLAVILLGVFALPAFGQQAPSGGEMPLDVYQRIKESLDALYGGEPLRGEKRAEVEKKLKAEAAAQKDVLIKALSSTQVIHREYAARALEFCGDRAAAVAPLCNVLTTDSDEGVRRSAAIALGGLADAASVDALTKGLQDDSDKVRGLSAMALGSIKDNRATGPLVETMKSDDVPAVRSMAAAALAKIQDATALPALEAALKDEQNEQVRMAIAGAIRAVVGGNTADTEPVPEQADALKELTELGDQMKRMEAKLRDDRHDQVVMNEGGDIEKRLQKLIEQIEKSQQQQQSSSSSSQQQQQQQQKKQQGQGNQPSQQKNASNPAQQSVLAGAVSPGAENALQVGSQQDPWAKLPKAWREEILQPSFNEVPTRWRKRLEAYYLSIAAEEAKSTNGSR